MLPVIGQDQRPPPVRPSACCLGFEGFPGLWLCSMPSGTPLFVPRRSWPPSARSALSYHTPLQRLTTIFPSIIPSIIHTVHHPEEPQLGRNGRRCIVPHPHALFCGMWASSFHYSSIILTGQSHFLIVFNILKIKNTSNPNLVIVLGGGWEQGASAIFVIPNPIRPELVLPFPPHRLYLYICLIRGPPGRNG